MTLPFSSDWFARWIPNTSDGIRSSIAANPSCEKRILRGVDDGR